MNKNLTRAIVRVRSILREAEQATQPCGIRPASEKTASDKLALAVRELEGALS